MSTKNKFYVGIKNEVATGTLELHFTDFIYNSFDWSTWEEKNMVQDTINQIKAANPTKIKLVINSLGGDVMIGLAIYNYLKSSGIEIESEVIGFAASIASVMAMAGSPVKMAKNSFMIIHAAWSGASGNASDMRKTADMLDKVSGELADIYAQKSGKHDAAYFTNLWAGGDVWLTATEAKELGLVDEITNEVSINASVDFNSYGFRNVPAQLKASAEPQQQSISQQIFDGFMKIKNSLLAALTGAKEDTATANVANKEDILAMVQNVLTPFAEAVDQALEELKPTATEEVPVVEETPAEEPVAEPAPAPAAEPVVNNEVEALKAEMAQLKAQIANGITKPATGKTNAEDLSAKINIEYE